MKNQTRRRKDIYKESGDVPTYVRTKGHRGRGASCTAHRLKIANFSRRITRCIKLSPEVNFAETFGLLAQFCRTTCVAVRARQSSDRLEIFTAVLLHLFGFRARSRAYKRKDVRFPFILCLRRQKS